MSRRAYQELVGADLGSVSAVVIDGSPAKDPRCRLELRAFESKFGPNVVFTFFGPAYVSFQALHLCGVANPWVVHPSWLAYKSLGFSMEVLRTPLRALYRAHWFRKADAWVVETAAAKEGLCRRLHLPAERVDVVSNNCGTQYMALTRSEAKRPDTGECVRLLCLSADYPHKNLRIIPYVAKELRDRWPSLSFEFVMTLPKGSPSDTKIENLARALGVGDRINNVGPISVSDAPSLYSSCHIIFLPSVLEVFSANFPEAMAVGRPIVTTNLQFARSICGEAATYFEPMDALSAAAAIISLLVDETRWRRSILDGKRILQGLPTPAKKLDLYMASIRKLCALGKLK